MERIPSGGQFRRLLETEQVEERLGKTAVCLGCVELNKGEGQLRGKTRGALFGKGTKGVLLGGGSDSDAFELREPDGFGRGGFGEFGVGEASEHEPQDGGV